MADLRSRYAKALFELALGKKRTKQYLEQAVLMRDALQNEECRSFIENLHVSGAIKREFLVRIFKEELEADLMGFLHLLIAKKREKIIVSALEELISMLNTYEGKTVANVISAVELRESQLAALRDTLSKKLNKQVEIIPRVDASLIGGLAIHVEGRLVDRTVKTQLNTMNANAKRGIFYDSRPR